MSQVFTAFLVVSVAIFMILMDRMCELRGLLPPGVREPWRRILAWAQVGLILWIGAFSSLVSIGQEQPEMDLSRLTTPQLFLLHLLLVLTVVY